MAFKRNSRRLTERPLTGAAPSGHEHVELLFGECQQYAVLGRAQTYLEIIPIVPSHVSTRPAGHELLATNAVHNRPGLFGPFASLRVMDHTRPYRHLRMARRWLP